MHTGQRKYNAYSNKSNPAELAPDLSLPQFKWKKPGKGKKSSQVGQGGTQQSQPHAVG